MAPNFAVKVYQKRGTSIFLYALLHAFPTKLTQPCQIKDLCGPMGVCYACKGCKFLIKAAYKTICRDQGIGCLLFN